MANATLTPSDSALIKQLRESYISPAQKTQLEGLISKMNDTEKAELLNLINRSHEEYKKASKAYAQTLDNLNKEYQQKLKEEDKGFRKELEGIEHAETSENLKVIEAEVYTIGTRSTDNVQRTTVKSHTIRNLVLALIFLTLLAGGGLYFLNSLAG